jgi:hypothetical protein
MAQSEETMIHNDCECIVVHPNGQLQTIRQCWCKLYHVFGEHIQIQDITEVHIKEDFHCIYLKNGQKHNQPNNINLERRLLNKVFGPGVIFRRGNDVSPEQAKNILMFK